MPYNMDQQSPDIQPSVELPAPQQEVPTPENTNQAEYRGEQANAQQIERGVSGPAPAVVTPQQQSAPQSVPVVAPHAAPPKGVTGVAAAPQIAEDTDLIEKEWVEKAKQIVERTRHDPRQQSNDMNLMKVDYLKKRYNKDVKLSE